MSLQRGRIGQPDETAGGRLLEIDLAAAGKRSLSPGDQRQSVLVEDETLDIFWQRIFSGEAEIGGTSRDGGGDIGAFALLDIDIDVAMFAQEGGERARQMFRQTGG